VNNGALVASLWFRSGMSSVPWNCLDEDPTTECEGDLDDRVAIIVPKARNARTDAVEFEIATRYPVGFSPLGAPAPVCNGKAMIDLSITEDFATAATFEIPATDLQGPECSTEFRIPFKQLWDLMGHRWRDVHYRLIWTDGTRRRSSLEIPSFADSFVGHPPFLAAEPGFDGSRVLDSEDFAN